MDVEGIMTHTHRECTRKILQDDPRRTTIERAKSMKCELEKSNLKIHSSIQYRYIYLKLFEILRNINHVFFG